jgi:3-oxoacyl-[acyl-carrier-protein] synthase II
MNHRRVVVTGIGAVCSLGNSLPAIWESAVRGQSGIGLIRQFDTRDWPVRIAGEVNGFHVGPFLAPEQLELACVLPRGLSFGIAAAAMALDGAKLLADSRPVAERFGIAVGAAGSSFDFNTCERFRQALTAPPPIRYPTGFDRALVLGRPQVGIAELMANRWQAAGPQYIISTACAASAQALGIAARAIRSGRADVMLAGGFDSPAHEVSIACFSRLGVLSQRNEDPSAASRPFDRLRDGFVMGEGSAMLVLEELQFAKERGAPILAELAGYGASLTTHHITATAPDGVQQARAMANALHDGGTDPSEVGYVNAHGTSTRDNDRSETAAICRAFGPYIDRLAISSTKSMTGHLVHAAGALEAAITVMSLRDQVAPPTINYQNPDPNCDLDYVPNEARRLNFDVAMSNSFAFGGNNAALLFKRCPN